jgi:hypothetical protein
MATTRFRLRPEVTATETDDGLVLLDERRGRYWHLNRSGAATLRLLLDGRSPDQVADALVVRFPAAAATAAGDVNRLIDSLRAAGMVYPS